MELFATDLERLAFLLEADAALTLDPDTLGTEAAEQSAPEELPPEKRPKYITNYIGIPTLAIVPALGSQRKSSAKSRGRQGR